MRRKTRGGYRRFRHWLARSKASRRNEPPKESTMNTAASSPPRTAMPRSSRSPSACAGRSSATSSAAAAFDFAKTFLPDGLSLVDELDFLSAPQRRGAEPGPGPHLRQHVRPGRALHRREDARGQPRARARRPGRVRGAGPLHRRGAEAPGAVPPHRSRCSAAACRRATPAPPSRTRSPAPCSARAPGRCSR